MQLTFDSDVEAFRAEFSAFLDENLPPASETLERPRSVSHMPQWARAGSGCCSTTAGCCPASPRNSVVATRRSFSSSSTSRNSCRRRIYHSFNPQGVNIVAASLLSFGSDEQKQRWAVPILRAEITASLGMSEPSAGSDLASLRTRAVLDGDHFVVNGQKVWTSGAHDADVLLTFVRTNPDAPKHKGISALIIPTDTPGVVRRPFPSICGADDLDFNEVFFTDVRVPAENLVGELNQGWRVANGSLGHERTMMWLGFADRLDNMIADFHPSTEVERDQYASTIMDKQALRLLGSVALARAARGEDDVAAISVLKLLGFRGRAAWDGTCPDVGGIRRARPPGPDRAVRAHEPRPLFRQLVRALRPQLFRDDRRRHLRDPAQHHRPASARSPAGLALHATPSPELLFIATAFNGSARPGRIW